MTSIPGLTSPQTAFATLTPSNARAKVLFSHVAPTILHISQQNRPHFANFMVTTETPVLDQDAAHFRQQSPSTSDSGDSTEAEILDAEEETKTLIWRGSYVFRLQDLGSNSDAKWIAGKGRAEDDERTDLRLALHTDTAAKRIRGRHIHFKLDRNGHMQVSIGQRSRDLQVAVDGTEVTAKRTYHINTPSAKIQIENLYFDFQYTNYARTPEFLQLRNSFVQRLHNLEDVLPLMITPTPQVVQQTIGKWKLHKNLGRGSFGKVYSASDSDGNTVAIKHLYNTSGKTESIVDEVRTLTTLSREALKAGNRNILLLQELFPEHISKNLASGGGFQDVWLVLTPACSQTLLNYCSTASKNKTPDILALLWDTLTAVQFLHERGWLHRDIKPANIGIHDHRAILLDLGGTIQLPDDKEAVPATPGHNGTIGYMSPEREGSHYGRPDDIWAVGVSFYQAFFGSHPWSQSTNPWRIDASGQAIEKFHHMENKALQRLRKEKSPYYINNLLEKMLRHEQSRGNQGVRFTAEEALHHPVFEILEEENDSD